MTDPFAPRLWERRWLRALVLVVGLGLGGIVLALEYLAHHAEPLVRRRIVETLSARFHEPVQLDRVEVSVWKGLEVVGYDLVIPSGDPGRPLMAVRRFAFRTSVRALLHWTTHVKVVEVDGMEVHIPPTNARTRLFGDEAADADTASGLQARLALVVDRLQCREVRLFLDASRPDKEPLLFAISSLTLQNVGRGQAMIYDATLTNPKPAGLVHATGHFGPWAGTTSLDNAREQRVGEPGATPIDGMYTLDHANLTTIHGLGGTLSSAGHFRGVLDRLVIEGTTDVPDFSLDVSSQPLPLHAAFHAVVDGTNGDTYLQPVQARLAHSEFSTWGKVVKVTGQGRDLDLHVTIPHGRMEDFLRLATRTSPPLMSGTLGMTARLRLSPGRERVPLRVQMEGSAQVTGVRFGNARWQSRLTDLSARAQGHPGQIGATGTGGETLSQLGSQFTLSHGVLNATGVRYTLPGVAVLMNGVYSMDGRLFEFKGRVRTEARASQMVTGWKSLLLQPFDRYLAKNGAGVELPIEVSGTQGDLHLGLALHGTDATPAQMLAEVKARQRGEQQQQRARQLLQQAAALDLAAAQAASVDAARKAHDAAVRLRAEATQLLQAFPAGAKAGP